MITVLFAAGTFEPESAGYPKGLLRRVADLLPRSRFECRQIVYPMDYGTPVSYEDSVQRGVRAMIAAIRNTPNPAALIGYSQGAVVVARVAAEIRDGKHPDLDVRMVVTVANPERAEREGVHNIAGSGIAGGRTLARCPFPVVQLALPDDAITSASPDSLWRTVADLSAYMSGDVKRWATQALAKITTGRMQNLSRWENWVWMLGQTPRRVNTAAREIAGYLSTPSIHTLYGVRKVPGTNVDHLTYATQRIGGL